MKKLRLGWRRMRYGTWLMMLGVDPMEASAMVNDAERFGHLDY